MMKTDIYTYIQQIFEKNTGNLFLLNRHTDPGMKNKVLIRVLRAYPKHVLVEVLDSQKKPLYQTSITYSPLLDRDNSGQHYAYEIFQVFTSISVIKDE